MTLPTRLPSKARKRKKKTMRTMTLPASCPTSRSHLPLPSPPLSSRSLHPRLPLAPPRPSPRLQPRKSQRRLVASLRKTMTKTRKSRSMAQAQTVRSLRLLCCSSNRMYKPYITLLLLIYLNKTMPLLLFPHEVPLSKARPCRSPVLLFPLLKSLHLLLPSQSPACLRTVSVSWRTELPMIQRVTLMLGLT